MAEPLGSPAGGTVAPKGRVERDALISLGILIWYPISISLLPTVGGLIGTTGELDPVDIIRWLILIAYVFVPIAFGIRAGWRAIRGGARDGIAAIAWIGLIGDVGVFAISLLFALGELVNPH